MQGWLELDNDPQAFIRAGGPEGRTRTQIYRDHFHSNVKAAQITAELTPLVHDGVVVATNGTQSCS